MQDESNSNNLEIAALRVLYDDALAIAGNRKYHDEKTYWIEKAMGYARAIKELRDNTNA